jgi:hypothetical protein
MLTTNLGTLASSATGERWHPKRDTPGRVVIGKGLDHDLHRTGDLVSPQLP